MKTRTHNNTYARKRGITLLLTLLALVVVTVLLVEFQSDAVVATRTEQFRLETLQCRYAAESAVVMARAMIQASRRKRPASTTPTAAEQPEPNEPSLAEPNDVYSEPNESSLTLPDVEPATPTEPRPAFVIAYETFEIGPATVTIEIHDENAKWPLYWFLQSPFESTQSASAAQDAFNRFSQRLGVDRTVAREAAQRAQDMGRGIEVPPPPARVASRSRGGQLQPRSRRVDFAERAAELEKLQKGMVQFASRWQAQLVKDGPEGTLTQPVTELPGRFDEYLSPWGVAQLNLNTASAPLLEAAYSPLGLTKQQAQDIARYAATQPLRSVNNLHFVQSLDVQLVNNLSAVSVVSSTMYSVHVEARVGRITTRLVGGIFQDLDWNVRIAGVFPGGG